MSKKFTLDQLVQDIRDRHVGQESARLVEKWTRTGLLRGLDQPQYRETMARLLENQAAQLLRESNALSTGGASLASSGQIRGFSNIAFPIVRRVFGGLVANELVSIQAMSLPSGLLFYLDYTYGSNVGMDSPSLGNANSTESVYKRGQSIYNNPAGKGVRSGSLTAGGQYDLVGTGFTKVHSGSGAVTNGVSSGQIGAWTSGSNAWADFDTVQGFGGGPIGLVDALTDFTGTNAKEAMFDPQLASGLDAGTLMITYGHLLLSDLTTAIPGGDTQAVDQIAIYGLGTVGDVAAWGESFQSGQSVLNLRRLNKRGTWNQTSLTWTDDPLGGNDLQVVFQLTGTLSPNAAPAWGTFRASMALTDALDVDSSDGSTLTVPSFESDFGSTPSAAIPEIDIKIESIAVTATTRKLRARWSPELAQDLNAYHSLDAEVELTQILSEQIALEIDREILGDLLREANGANLYWSRSPGKILNKVTGNEVLQSSTLAPGPAFTGTVREWYETLSETITDVANTIHRKTLRGSANFVVTSPDVCTILEHSLLYKANISIDGSGQVGAPFSVGAEAVGTLTNRYTVYKDPYFPRNKLLVGYKGGSYLETGYVYAPYVPLIVTPTIFGPEDFTPRKGVMTRYGKKMVRSDFYGTVTVVDLDVI